MKIEQKKLSITHTFDFQDKYFNFAYKDRSGSGDADVAYANLASKTSVKIEDNSWWRNAGYIWCVIGILNIGWGLASGAGIAGRGFWLMIGLICLIVYRVTRVQYTVLGFDGGNVFIIQDKKTHDQVLGELMDRRKKQLLSLYGEIDLESNLERETAKFNYLREQGVLSQEEADTKIQRATLALGDMSATSTSRTLN